jgi:hypothetical protein
MTSVKPKLAGGRDGGSRPAWRKIASGAALAESRARMLDRMPAPARRLLLNRVVQTALGAVAIAWLTWPVDTLTPAPGVDAGWQAGLNMASHQSLQFGQDVIFSYGPLGFLAFPFLYYPVNAGLAGLYVGALQVGTAGSLLWTARASFGFFGAALIALAIAKMAILVLPTTLLVAPLAFLWCAYAIRRGSARWFLVIAVAGGLVGSLELLIRLNVGIVVLALCGLTLVMERERRLRNLAVFVASVVTSFLVFWLAAGGNIGAVPDYLRNSHEIVAGYSDAMSFEDLSLKWEYFAAAAVAGVVLLMGWRNTAGWSRRGRLKLLVLGAVLAYATFKQGFVRHDVYHSGVWFISAAVVLNALAWRRDHRVETLLALVCALLALAGGRATVNHLNPGRSASHAVSQLRTMLTSKRLRVIDEARAAMQSFYGLNDRIVAFTRGRTVDVYGTEASVAWAYPEMRWHPLPVFQSYSTYTRRLDRLNASALANSGPDFVLRDPDVPEDNRSFTLEAPETMLTMFCRYTPMFTTSRWQLLRREADRCGTPHKLATVHTRVGDHFAVPRGTGRGVIVMDLRGFRTPLWQRLRTLLFRRDGLFLLVNDTSIIRMVPGTVTGPMIVRVPQALDYGGRFPLSMDARSLAFFEYGAHNAGPPLTADFYEVPIASGSRP